MALWGGQSHSALKEGPHAQPPPRSSTDHRSGPDTHRHGPRDCPLSVQIRPIRSSSGPPPVCSLGLGWGPGTGPGFSQRDGVRAGTEGAERKGETEGEGGQGGSRRARGGLSWAPPAGIPSGVRKQESGAGASCKPKPGTGVDSKTRSEWVDGCWQCRIIRRVQTLGSVAGALRRGWDPGARPRCRPLSPQPPIPDR